MFHTDDISAEYRDSLINILAKSNIDNVDSLTHTIKRFRQMQDSTAIAIAYYAAANSLQHKQNYTTAIETYKMSLQAMNNHIDTVLQLKTLNGMATCFRRMGSLFEASDYLYTALNIAEQYSMRNTENGKELRSHIYNNIGNVYKYLNNGEEAEDFFRRSLALDKELDNTYGMAKNYSTLGNIYEHRNMFDSAYIMYHKALNYDMIAGSRFGMGICHNRIGQLLMHQDSIDKALEHHRKAYDLLNGKYDSWNRMKAALSMAWIYLVKHDLPKAYKLLKESEEEALKAHSFGHLEEVYYCMAEYYRQQKNYRQAFEQQALCIQYRDSMAKQRDEQEVARNRVRYERQKSEVEINRLNYRNEKVKANRRVILISSIIIASILLLLLFVSYFFIRLQRRRNVELREMNATKDKFFSIISHDLKNPAIAQRNALKGLISNKDQLDENTLANYYSMLLKSADSQVELLYNLLDWARVQTGRLPYKPTTFNICTVLENEIELMQIVLTNKNIKLKTDFIVDILVKGDRNMTATTFRNLLSNAIKFTNEGGEIHVGTALKNDNVSISVSDKGIGMDAEKVRNLFKLDRQQSTLGTCGETGSGIGLVVCKNFVERNGGTLTVESVQGKGSTFRFTMKRATSET